MKLALLVIDMQKCFISEYADQAKVRECCEYINHTIGIVRSAGHIVIHIQDVESAAEVGAEQLEFIDEIDVKETDVRVQKEHSNAFWQTDLKQVLKDNEIDFLVVCGQAAEHCVLFTYNGAWERGHTAAILQHGVLSQKPNRAEELQQDRHVISYPVVRLLASQPS